MSRLTIDEAGASTLAMPAKLMFALSEVAELTSLSERFIWGLADAGDLPSVRVGQRVLVRAADLHAWIDAGCPHPKWTEQQAAEKLAREAAKAARAANQEERPRSRRKKKK